MVASGGITTGDSLFYQYSTCLIENNQLQKVQWIFAGQKRWLPVKDRLATIQIVHGGKYRPDNDIAGYLRVWLRLPENSTGNCWGFRLILDPFGCRLCGIPSAMPMGHVICHYRQCGLGISLLHGVRNRLENFGPW